MRHYFDADRLATLSFSDDALRWLRQGLVAVLLIWCLYSLAQLLWLLIVPATSVDLDQPLPALVNVETSTSGNVDIEQVKSYALFGAENSSAPVPVVTAPVVSDEALNAEDTKLALELLGVVYSDDQSRARAVIVYQNKQDQYNVGDKLPVSDRVELYRVLQTRVIIANNGRYESLWLYDEKNRNRNAATRRTSRATAASAAVNPNASVNPNVRRDLRNDSTAVTLANDYRNRLYRDPQSLAEAIRISPVQRDGQLLGYRVAPGRDSKQFKQLGFEPNDIVTSINGISLDQPSNAVEVYRVMQSATEASFIIQRGDESLELLVVLGAGEDAG